MVYIAYAVFSLSVALLGGRSEKKLAFLFFCLLLFGYCVFFGLSYKAGSDWVNYFANYSSGCGNPNFEVGFQSLCWFFYTLGIDYWFFVFFIKVFYIVVLAVFIWKSGAPPLEALALYVLVSPVFLENLLRQQISSAIILFGLFYLRSGILIGAFFVLLASIFHISAIFCLPLWVMYKSKFARSLVFYLSVLFFLLHSLSLFAVGDFLKAIVLKFPDSNFLGKVGLYLDFESYPVTFGHFLRFCLLLVFAFFFRKAKIKFLNHELYVKLCILYSGFLLMVFYEMVFYDFGVFWMRVREFFVLFFILFPLYLARNYYPRFYIYIFGALVVYALYVFYGFYSLPVFDELYMEYRNYIAESFSSDFYFNASRDSAVKIYWENWRRGEIR